MRAALTAVLSCAAYALAEHEPQFLNPDGPFGDGSARDPISIDYDTYARHIKGANRDGYNVVMLMTSNNCHNCPYYSKQYEDFVHSYKDQYKGGRVYHEDKPVYFVKVEEGSGGGNKAAIRRELHLRHMPSLIIMPPYVEGGANKNIEFGRSPLDDSVSKKSKKENLRFMEDLKKLGKETPSLGQAAKRRERRKRQIMTQEEMEYDAYGSGSHVEFKTNNICKFLKMKAGTQLSVCPQDVALDFEKKKKPQDVLKNVLVFIILGSAGIVLCRVFGVLLPTFCSSRVDLIYLVHKKNCIENDDEHNMADLRADWELYITYATYASWVFVYSLLAGGMYWNVLNGVKWAGPTLVAPGSRKQYGSESVLLGFFYSMATFAMVIAGASMSQDILAFTKSKYAALSLPPALRSSIRAALAVVGVSGWVCMFYAILRMFLFKNGSYMNGTALQPLITMLRPRW